MSPATNTYEATARAAKVDAVVSLLDQMKNGCDMSDRAVLRWLVDLPDAMWQVLEIVAEVKPLSATSRSAVLRRFENRVRG